ncbi:MAG: GTPase ObgE [Oscillospiraceae bacterium]|nr:GTPase ObgE [Oscillospiraceae bacterium]
MSSGFVDKVSISVRAGKGGDGAVTFHREKYIAAGGPDGGDGGRGGDVILKVDEHMSTLMDFRYKRKFAAQDGQNGSGKRCSGRDGESVVIKVPRGTLVRDRDSGAIMADLSDNRPFVVCRGGRGGWGNSHFATSTRQVPHFAKPGMPGERHDLILELKLLADVGLVGFPNAGKSTLLASVSRARPKIADYHFTTLSPNLGVVYVGEGSSFVLADIPGIIEGASEGAGLGHDFLRHIDRCRLLIHVVDVSGCEGRDPVEDFDAIEKELAEYSPELSARPRIVAANKCDILPEGSDNLERLHQRVREKGWELLPISAATTAGTKELMNRCAAELRTLPPITVYEPDYVAPEPALTGRPEDVEIWEEDGVWYANGPWLDHLVASVNFSDYESRMYFDKMLRQSGIFQRMEEMGIREKDTVSIQGMTFEFTY